LKLIPASQLTQNRRDEAHLIFVGKDESFAILNEVNLPLSASAAEQNTRRK
jgi:hypothetical protein